MMKTLATTAIMAGVACADVKVLDSDNFDATTTVDDITLVKFYAPWCGHCKKIAPEFEKASETLEGKATLAEVDCTADESKAVCTKHGVRGYPTLKIFRAGTAEPTDYDGPRDAKGISNYMIKQTQPAFKVVDAAGLKEMTDADTTLVLHVASESGDAYDAFTKLANAQRNDFNFAIVTDAALSKAEGASVPSVTMYRAFDEPKVTHEGSLDAEGFAAFISAESMPLFGEIGPENYQKYMQRGLPLAWAFVDYPASAETDAMFTAIAKEHKGKLSFVKLDAERWAQHGKSMGVNGQGLVIQKERKNYLYSGDWEQKGLAAHATAFVAGELKPHLKSEPIPETQDEPVYTLVGKNFEEIVYDNTKDVFVEFYAPWCGHCKSLAPKYDALGEEYSKVDSVIIAKCDATENDTPIEVSGFPTLFMFPADDNKDGIKYEGDRTQEAMSSFIKKNAKSDLSAHGHDEL